MLYVNHISMKLEGKKKSQGPTLGKTEISKLLDPLHLPHLHFSSLRWARAELQKGLHHPPLTQGCRGLGRQPLCSLRISVNHLLPTPPHSASFSVFGRKFLSIGTFGSQRTYHIVNLAQHVGKHFHKYKVLRKQG